MPMWCPPRALVSQLDLSTLDAIHLTSMMLIRNDLTAFVAHDSRLIRAAEAVGIQAVRPEVS